MKKLLLYLIISFLSISFCNAAYLLIPMDDNQSNHLKAYGIAYWILGSGSNVDWLLNYRGGSFCIGYAKTLENEMKIRGVGYEVLPDASYNKILLEIANPEENMDLVKLEKLPRVAVYSPKGKQPWDDAVTLVLTYAEIPYDIVYDEELLEDELPKYDWLHLHHEDFTGQYGKFYANYRNEAWYKDRQKEEEARAAKYKFSKVSQMKLAVAHKIRDYVLGGGFMFAMCSATDTYDIALAAEGTDICDRMFDGDGPDPHAQEHLDFSKTFAFKDFKIVKNPFEYEHGNVDVTKSRGSVSQPMDQFTLFEFSAKWDPVPTMLTQSHQRVIKGFMGQTTAFKKKLVKKDVLILGENKGLKEARYIHGEHGYGTWTFYGGHDPEDYRHFVNDPPTDLNLHPNSPGYRLILNNVLFPAAKKQKQKT